MYFCIKDRFSICGVALLKAGDGSSYLRLGSGCQTEKDAQVSFSAGNESCRWACYK
jgi:hypothetical protein